LSLDQQPEQLVDIVHRESWMSFACGPEIFFDPDV